MRRDEAVNLLKELSDKCVCLTPYAIMLMPPDANDVLSQGYQLHIKANLHPEDLSCMKPHVEKQGLKLKKEKDLLAIYKPLKADKKNYRKHKAISSFKF
jgi:hypothetical protein